MNKDIGKILNEVSELMEDHYSPDQFRRGIDTIHDIIQSDVKIAEYILDQRHHGNAEEMYFNIIQHSFYAIAAIRKKEYEDQPHSSSEIESDVILNEATEMIENIADGTNRMVFNEKIDNKYSDEVDRQINELDSIVGKAPIISKNQRRTR